MTKTKLEDADVLQRPAKEDLAAEWADPASLLPWRKNPRRNAEAVGRVAASIKRLGFGAPLVARREDRRVVAGHTRLAAAMSLKLARVPVRFMDISEEDANKLAIADNKLGEIATWDDAALMELLGGFSLSDAALVGFDAEALEKLAEELCPSEKAEGDGSPKLGHGLAYKVIVDCADEDQQAEILNRLEGEGLVCRPLIA